MIEINILETKSWQVPRDKRKLIENTINKLKDEYAQKVAEAIYDLPEEYHQIGFYEAENVGLQVSTAFCRKWQ
jgi:hypothetical protein